MNGQRRRLLLATGAAALVGAYALRAQATPATHTVTIDAFEFKPAALTVKQGDVVVVDVEGQLIVGNRQELKQKVLDELERGERKFLIDFSQTGYIDSSGLGVLVSLSKKIREQGGELRLANLNDDLKTLFELTKLDTLFQIADTRERGLESF